MCGPLDTCESMWTSFHELVHSGLDIIMPEKQIHIHPTDAPWMTQKLKSLILSRQKAFQVCMERIHLNSNTNGTVSIENEKFAGRSITNLTLNSSKEKPRESGGMRLSS